MFHSGRMTLRNCRFLREYTAIIPEVHQPIPFASLPGSTSPVATECDPPNVASGPPQINRPRNHQQELPVAPTCDVQPPSPSTTTGAVKRVPRALTTLFDYNKSGLKECSGPVVWGEGGEQYFRTTNTGFCIYSDSYIHSYSF